MGTEPPAPEAKRPREEADAGRQTLGLGFHNERGSRRALETPDRDAHVCAHMPHNPHSSPITSARNRLQLRSPQGTSATQSPLQTVSQGEACVLVTACSEPACLLARRSGHKHADTQMHLSALVRGRQPVRAAGLLTLFPAGRFGADDWLMMSVGRGTCMCAPSFSPTMLPCAPSTWALQTAPSLEGNKVSSGALPSAFCNTSLCIHHYSRRQLLSCQAHWGPTRRFGF